MRGFKHKKIDVAGKRSSAIVIECAFRCYVARCFGNTSVGRAAAIAGYKALVAKVRRRKVAYILCEHLRKIRDGATAFQKVWRMFYLRKKYVSKILDAIELQRHLRRWLAENEASRRREEKERKRKARLKIENAAMTIVQSTARVWLAKRMADRKREVMDNAQDDLDTVRRDMTKFRA